MPDLLAFAQRIISIGIDASQAIFTVWMATGGINFVLRSLSFTIDNLIVNFIGTIYKYFMMLLEGTMFNPEVTNAVMKNIYIFIGVIVFFRLMMVLLKYIVSPELVSDGKAGASNLVKRVIIGMAGITLIPTIFNLANDLQVAIIKDQLIQRIIIPKEMIEVTKEKVDNGGKYIGTYILAGFINPASSAPKTIKDEFRIALSKGDLSSIDYNSGGFLGIGYTPYHYSYFFLLSTFVLGYVLYLMLKYCLDIVVRFFKLFLYQLLAPIAMIEYMINGSENGVFKNWRTAVLGTYFMLFVRIFAIWFVIFVMSLMSGELPGYSNGSLIALSFDEDYYLLRALIMIGLLAFMMDLPKLVGGIFGLDLEQESSATGLLKTITGGLTKIAGAGMAMGGAALGGMVGAAKGGLGAINQKMANKATNPKTKDYLSNRANKLGNLDTSKNALKAARKGMVKSAMGMSQLTAAAHGAYGSVGDSVKAKEEKAKAEKAQEAQEQRERERDRREIERDRRDAEYKQKTLEQQRRDSAFETGRMYNESQESKGKSKDEQIEDLKDLLFKGKMSDLDLSAVENQINSLLSSGSPMKVVADLVNNSAGKSLHIQPQEVERIVNDVYTNGGGSTIDRSQRIVDEVRGKGLDICKKDAEMVVNQTYGHRVMDTVDDAVQNVHQDFTATQGKIDNIDQTINRHYVTTHDQIDNIQRNIHDNFTTTHDKIENVRRTTHNDSIETRKVIDDSVEILDETLRNTDRKTDGLNRDEEL